MTTLYPFEIVNPNVLFSFQPTLDGSIYTVEVFWNYWAQRWYFRILDQFGNRVVTRALVGSEAPHQIAALSWYACGAFVKTFDLLPYRIGTIVQMSIYGCSPNSYNGTNLGCTIADKNLFSYDIMTPPTPIVVLGSYSLDINLIWDYFTTSSMVFRPSTGNFEINP